MKSHRANFCFFLFKIYFILLLLLYLEKALFCYVIYLFDVYLGNPRDGYYFHQQNKNNIIKANKDQDLFWWHWKEPFGMAPQTAVLKFSWTFVRGRYSCFFYKFLISTRLSIEVIEYERFWNNNSLIRRKNCEHFCFNCDLNAFEQHPRFRAFCQQCFSRKKVTAPQVRRCLYAYESKIGHKLNTNTFAVHIKAFWSRDLLL